jgi:hypothetical protein
MGGMGLIPRSSQGDLELISCINYMRKALNLKGFRDWGEIPKIRMGMISRGKMPQGACTLSPHHDPSSQPSHLECKMKEISKISKKT